METYLFYDIETTGLNKAFDQVLHFAAIRTDLNLNEINRYELKIKLNPDVTPSPGALITHRISMTETLAGVKEIDAMLQIHQWLNEPGTISLGYNTLGFDDEFLRFSFYRNLLPPYTHQYANQCKRMDLYPMTLMYYLFKNHVLQWPFLNEKRSLKLELINHVNQFVAGRSHNAMVDVEVTLALARRFLQEKDMWDYLAGYFNKQIDLERIQKLPAEIENSLTQHREGLMIYGKFGSKDNYQAAVLYIGESGPYKNQQLWLRLDAPELRQTTAETIADTTWVVRKKAGEPPFILPLTERFLKDQNSHRQAQATANKAWIKQNPELFQKIIDYHVNFTYPYYPDTEIEAGLYLNGFWSADEMSFCRRFHQVLPAEKAVLAQNLTNPKLKILAIRLLGRNYPEVLSAEQKQDFDEYLQQVKSAETTPLIDFKGNKRLSPQTALRESNELRTTLTLDTAQKELLDELEIYLKAKLA